ncbi:acyltransferase domain-containing protein [Sulfitobacter aestuariivivens]|uniref:acyltransferase domain-containing protein n=1 Tax=Sulfitobacter aestuariivivens TaxID=2766981 RepID=UPI00361B5F73
MISAHSKAALEANTAALAAHLRAHPEQPLADVAYTLKEGRRAFAHRRVVVAESHAEAADLLEAADTRRVFTHEALGADPDVVFMFPGGGAQYAGMARDLYTTEPVFADWMDRGIAHLQPQLTYDIRALWLPEAGQSGAADAALKQPSVQLPLIAITEYALARLWLSWGVTPAAMVGHSMGENVAACLAGVMRFEDLIDLVLLRGQLFDEVPAGGMLSISASMDQIAPLLGDDLDIASINAPELIAVSGPQAALDAMQRRLEAAEIDSQRVAIDIAAHSRMLEGILDRYRAFLATLDLQAPKMTFVSNRSGATITAEEATDPDYWVGQLRNTVHFAECIKTLSAASPRVFLEVGPGKALSALASMNPGVRPGQVMSTLRHPEQDVADDVYFMSVIARLWACGCAADWSQIWGTARRNRVLLPSYQFQRNTYFIEPGKAAAQGDAPALARRDDMADWGYAPTWKPAFADTDADALATLADRPQTWLIFADDAGLAAPVKQRLRVAGHRVIAVRAGDAFAQIDEDRYTIAAEQGRAGYDQLIAALGARGVMPDRIAHFWLTDDHVAPRPGSSVFDRNIEQGFWSLTWLAQALTEAGLEGDLHLDVFTTGAAQVAEEALTHPEKALIAGPVGVFAREMPGVSAAQIDVEEWVEPPAERRLFARAAPAPQRPDITDRLLEDMLATPANTVAAHRGDRRYVLGYKSIDLPSDTDPAFRDGGIYLITGGFGGIGLTLAADILQRHDATVVLLTRDGLPDRKTWKAYLDRNGTTDPIARRIQAAIRLEDLGRVEVAGADVANLAKMRRVVQDLTDRHGRITGVIHAAGVLDDGPLLGKTDAQMDAVLSPKVQGLRVLDHLLPDGTCEMMVLFSSTSTATRAAGQVDYVAANAWLNAFAASRKGGKTRVTAVNWGIWADVGMATKALPGAASDVMPARPLDAALLETAGVDDGGDPIFATTLSTDDWVLDQHRTKNNQALMPGTGYLELLAEAAATQGLAQFEIKDLYFLRAMPVADGARRQVQLTLKRDGTGYAAEVRSDCMLDGRTGWQLHAQATLSGHVETPVSLDLRAIGADCSPRQNLPRAACGRHRKHT